MAMTRKNAAIQAAKAAALAKAARKAKQPKTVAALLAAPTAPRKRAPGAGRPVVADEIKLMVCSFRADRISAAKFKALGGGDWVRPLLAKAVIPSRV